MTRRRVRRVGPVLAAVVWSPLALAALSWCPGTLAAQWRGPWILQAHEEGRAVSPAPPDQAPSDATALDEAIQDIVSGAARISRESLDAHVASLATAARESRRGGAQWREARATAVESELRRMGLPSAGAVAPFVKEHRQSFEVSFVEADPAAPPAEIRILRGDGESLHAATVFPVVPSANACDPSEAIFADPEDLVWAALSEAPPGIGAPAIVTVERPPATPDDLAEQILGAAKLGAALLIVARGSDGPSLYEPLLSSPPRASLPLSRHPPGPLVLSAPADLGIELLGRAAFSRYASVPLTARDPGFRPVLLDPTVAASAPLRVRTERMDNLIAYLEGSDPTLKNEVVILTAAYAPRQEPTDGAQALQPTEASVGAAMLLETARWLSGARWRPARSLIVAALDGDKGLAGARALAAARLDPSVRPVAVIHLGSALETPGPPRLIGGSREPRLGETVSMIASRLGLDLDPQPEDGPFARGGDHDPFRDAGMASIGLYAATDTDITLVSRLAALTAWMLAA